MTSRYCHLHKTLFVYASDVNEYYCIKCYNKEQKSIRLLAKIKREILGEFKSK